MTEKKVLEWALEMACKRMSELSDELHFDYITAKQLKEDYINKAEAELKEHNGTA